VRQTETAALKQGLNSKGLFARELTEVYTTATFLGDAVLSESPDPSYMMCVLDAGDDRVALVAVSLRTSDLTFDLFKDGFARLQLETRLAHIKPVEVLLCAGMVGPATEALVKTYASREKEMRVTRLSKALGAKEAAALLDDVYKENASLAALLGPGSALPDVVVQCLALLGQYLKQFGLERAILLADGLQKWSRNEMVLNAETLSNLNVFGKGPGSLQHLVDRTVSPMGSRMMRYWLGHPLTSLEEITARQDAVDATRALLSAKGVRSLKGGAAESKSEGQPLVFVKLMQQLRAAGDLEQSISAIYHRRCQPGKFVATLKAFIGLLTTLEACRDSPNTSSELVAALLHNSVGKADEERLRQYMEQCLADLDHQVAASDQLDWMSLFVGRLKEPVPKGREVRIGSSVCDNLAEARAGIREQEAKLAAELTQLRVQLGLPKLEYKSVNGREFLVEIPRASKAAKCIPDDWEADQHIKAALRYVTPNCKAHLLRLNMFREAAVLLAKTKWTIFLEEFSALYGSFKSLVGRLARLDCITGLALLAQAEGYVRPRVAAGAQQLHIMQGRHPCAETLVAAGSFICNDTELRQGGTEHMVVTGPNMGGKSTYIRGVAQTVILAQLGSFVPAQECSVGIFDAIYVRMGAEDSLYEGRSTFFTELLSTSTILDNATERSLVIIDELGRGTSTFDGAAIAYATLRHLAETLHCLSFFVTHFPLIGSLAATHPNVSNAHVSYLGGGTRQDPITFLFQVRPGLESRSYGLNVAQMAFGGAWDDVLQKAAHYAAEMEERERRRRLAEFAQVVQKLK
jgi:DNA mismatch repair protein MSH3